MEGGREGGSDVHLGAIMETDLLGEHGNEEDSILVELVRLLLFSVA